MNSVHLLTQEKYRVENRFENQVGCTECTVLASPARPAGRCLPSARAHAHSPAPVPPSAPAPMPPGRPTPHARAPHACLPAVRALHAPRALPARPAPARPAPSLLPVHCHNTTCVLRYSLSLSQLNLLQYSLSSLLH